MCGSNAYDFSRFDRLRLWDSVYRFVKFPLGTSRSDPNEGIPILK